MKGVEKVKWKDASPYNLWALLHATSFTLTIVLARRRDCICSTSVELHLIWKFIQIIDDSEHPQMNAWACSLHICAYSPSLFSNCAWVPTSTITESLMYLATNTGQHCPPICTNRWLTWWRLHVELGSQIDEKKKSLSCDLWAVVNVETGLISQRCLTRHFLPIKISLTMLCCWVQTSWRLVEQQQPNCRVWSSRTHESSWPRSQ